jgi:protoporphyrin/coproporphyrin ferrochelatase
MPEPKVAVSRQKIAVLLVNLGSPSAPTNASVRRYLKEFLSDPRVVNLPRWIWWIILNFIILPFRPAKSAKAYRQIWMDEGPPLVVLTRALTKKLVKKFQSYDGPDDYHIEMAMRYGKPAIREKLAEIKATGIDRLTVLPLYPQYSSTTTASVFAEIFAEINQWRAIPSIHFISDYHQDPEYISAIAASIKESWQQHGKGQRLVLSFHGLPAVLIKWGDPYFDQCQRTANLITEELGLQSEKVLCVFQSRFGRAEWLQPYCINVLEQLPSQGIADIDIVCPGFAVDCLETLEEIALTNKAVFLQAGGKRCQYIPALNASEAHVNVLFRLINDKRL